MKNKNAFYTEIGEEVIKLLNLESSLINKEELGNVIYSITRKATKNSDKRAMLEENDENWRMGWLTPEEYQKQKEKIENI